MKQLRVEVAALSELRRPGSSTISMGRYTYYWSGRVDLQSLLADDYCPFIGWTDHLMSLGCHTRKSIDRLVWQQEPSTVDKSIWRSCVFIGLDTVVMVPWKRKLDAV